MYNDEKYINDLYEFKRKAYKEHKLKAVFFEVTSRCNARCEHCGSSCGDFVPKDEITKDEIISVLDDLAEHYDPNHIMLFITGGEPLVRKDLFELMDYAHKLGFHWGMTTNGMLLDEEVVKKMRKTHMESISVSIDGVKETHEKFRKVPGSFDKILHGLKLMQKLKDVKSLQVTTCVNKKNIDELEDIFKIVKDIGITDWRLIEVDPIGRAKGNKDLLLEANDYKRMFNFIFEKRKKYPKMLFRYGCGHFLGNDLDVALMGNCYFCYTGYWVGSVLSNGDVFGCPDIERRPELIQGNIRKRKFSDIWENEFKPYRKVTRTSNSKCKKCPDWKSCMGDAFHTWDFDKNKPDFCAREIFKEDFKKKDKLLKDYKKMLEKINKGE